MNAFRVDCWQHPLLHRFLLIPFELIYVPGVCNISQTNPLLPFPHSDNFFSPQIRLKRLPALQLQTLGASANLAHSVSRIRPAKSANVVPSESLPEVVCYTTHQACKQNRGWHYVTVFLYASPTKCHSWEAPERFSLYFTEQYSV